jgi:two-component system, sensor histidine kinase and response regulator
VADPVPETARVIELVLGTSGDCEVSRCEHPRQAFEIVRKGATDLVLMDAAYGEGASLDFCRRLRADPDWSHFPVILFSSIHDRGAMLEGFRAGAVDYLFKPLFPTELAARVRTHFELKRQTDLTRRKVIEQRELLQLMCHDVTGPVGSVRAALDLCAQDPELFGRVRRHMEHSLDRVLELVDLVRKMRACEDGKMEFDLKAWPLSELIEESVAVVSDRLAKKGLEVTRLGLDGLAVTVEAVSFINSVMANLLTNAIKFSYAGSRIEIGASVQGNRVFLLVEDSGIGIPERLRARLFDPNECTSRPGTECEPGTGYGMLLVKKFVEAYGGRIVIESRDRETHPRNHGTRIILELPKG